MKHHEDYKDTVRTTVSILAIAVVAACVAVVAGVTLKRAEAAPTSTQQAKQIAESVYRIYDMEHGVACYIRAGSSASISCVRVGP